MLSEWQQKIKEKFDKGLDLKSSESNNFIGLLKEFNKKHGLVIKNGFTGADLLQEGGWFYVRTKNGVDVLVQMCTYQVLNEDVEYVWVEYNKTEPSVNIEINYSNGSNKEYRLLESEEIVEFYP